MTGLSSTERKEVQRLCELHGANYSGHLRMNECTHLIVSEPTGKLAKKVQAYIFRKNRLVLNVGTSLITFVCLQVRSMSVQRSGMCTVCRSTGSLTA